MLSVLLTLLLVTISGCFGTMPCKENFPEVPALLMKQPQELQKLPDSQLTLSVITDTGKDNNAIAFDIREQLKALQDWIKIQQSK